MVDMILLFSTFFLHLLLGGLGIYIAFAMVPAGRQTSIAVMAFYVVSLVLLEAQLGPVVVDEVSRQTVTGLIQVAALGAAIGAGLVAVRMRPRRPSDHAPGDETVSSDDSSSETAAEEKSKENEIERDEDGNAIILRKETEP